MNVADYIARLCTFLLKPLREYQRAKFDYRCAIAEQDMVLRFLETGEPQQMPEEFVEYQRMLGRPIGLKPGAKRLPWWSSR